MRRTILLALGGCLLAMQSCRRSAAAPEPVAEIAFLSDTRYDFSAEGANDTVQHWFVYRNTGDVPFVVNEVKTSCGCTSASFSKEPLAPGATDSILVTLALKGLIGGYLYKNCRIYSNADSVYRLILHGQHTVR